MVAAHRGDGMGLEMIREMLSISIFVISKERNPVVARRCEKLKIPYRQGIDKKASVLQAIFSEQNIDPAQAAYIGNDVNDLECFDLVGYRVAPADAHEAVKQRADLVLQKKGGHGAVREFCDRLMEEYA
jgi:N-acylneuraminate cytidylyltransferase